MGCVTLEVRTPASTFGHGVTLVRYYRRPSSVSNFLALQTRYSIESGFVPFRLLASAPDYLLLLIEYMAWHQAQVFAFGACTSRLLPRISLHCATPNNRTPAADSPWFRAPHPHPLLRRLNGTSGDCQAPYLEPRMFWIQNIRKAKLVGRPTGVIQHFHCRLP